MLRIFTDVPDVDTKRSLPRWRKNRLYLQRIKGGVQFTAVVFGVAFGVAITTDSESIMMDEEDEDEVGDDKQVGKGGEQPTIH